MPKRTARGVSAPIRNELDDAPAQPIVDKPRDTGTIAGARKTMREPPRLERVRGRTTFGFDRGKNLYGGSKPCGWRHGKASRIRMM